MSPNNAKPQAPRPDLESIPPDMRREKSWVNWHYQSREGDWTKVPIDPKTGRTASSTDPLTWGTDAEALASFEGDAVDGIGFVFTPPFCGVDLDDCRDPETGEIQAWARDIVKRLGSYTEVSPSGRGLHIILRGKLPPRGNRKGNIEMYDEGRYFCVTGQHLDGTPLEVNDRQEELSALHAEVFGQAASPPLVMKPAPRARHELSDEEILKKASTAKNGEKFKRLWAGDTNLHDGDDSRADESLVCLLAFYTGPDPERIERLFGQSKLADREKWRQRPDYRQRTIAAALKVVDTYYGDAPDPASNKIIEGPFGLRAELRGVRKTSAKITVQIHLTTQGQTLPFALSTSESSIEGIAAEIHQGIPRDGRSEGAKLQIKCYLRRILEEATKLPKEWSGKKTAIELVMEEAKSLRLAFRDEKERVWSEARKTFLYQRQFVEAMIRPAVLGKLREVVGFEDKNDAVLASAAKRLSEVVWAEIASNLPSQADAQDLGPESAAARETRRAINEVWTTPRNVGREPLHTPRLISLVEAAHSPNTREKYSGKWAKLHPFSAWYRVGPREGTGEVVTDLAMRFELLHQCGTRIPGINDQESFGNVLEKYGIVASVDVADHRVGKERTKVRLISADFADELSASFSGEE